MADTKSEPFHMQDLDQESARVSVRSGSETASVSQPSRPSTPSGSTDDLSSIDYSEYKASGRGLSSTARVTDDGRIDISLSLKQQLPELPPTHAKGINEFAIDHRGWREVPPLNIVIMIVGSRGDVQPYVALGQALRKDGHRIRIATHETFQSFVQDSGLEFFNIGGNPQDLMSYMVKNPGLIPGLDAFTNGDIGKKRKMLSEMIMGCWFACHKPCPTTHRTFLADAIISNPPAFAHVHCAEALGVPLLMSFTMPWSPTTAFPHPLANISESNAEIGLTNYLSYALTDLLTWKGTGDLINTLRTQTLGLAPLSLRSGPGLVDRLKVPWTYCMSPGLVKRPGDWKEHIDISGFYFLDLASTYVPSPELNAFLMAGAPPIYIGFGSVVVDDPDKLTKTILSALSHPTPIRALLSVGWGGLGTVSVPPHIMLLGNVPHDWLFERVSAVVHHGGAGTTAIGLKKGCPTVVVPFFGDQGFWGGMTHKAGAGPAPIPQKELISENLRVAIEFALSPGAKSAARTLAEQICKEEGVKIGVESFYRHLPLLNMRCDLDPSRVAVWWSTQYFLKLSAFAAQTLVDAKQLKFDSLDLHRAKEYDTKKLLANPAAGGASAFFWTITYYYEEILQLFYYPTKHLDKATIAIPRGVTEVVTAVHWGVHQAPKLYGSKVRKRGEVTGLASGLKEAGKGLFYGYYDGITGLVTEPIKGAKKEGVVGAIKGSARSFVNATMRPAAGVLGVIAYPIEGAWKTMQCAWDLMEDQQLRETRVSDGLEEVRKSALEEREAVLDKFGVMKMDTEKRHEWWKAQAENAMLESEDQNSAPEGSSSSQAPRTLSVPPPTPQSLPSQDSSDPHTPSPLRSKVDDEEAAFEKDIELAKQLSLEGAKREFMSG